MIDLHNRKFQAVHTDGSGEVSGQTQFSYYQTDDVVWGTYSGGAIRFGTLTGLVDADDRVRFAYQHVNVKNEIVTGHCISTPELLPDGRVRLHEAWEWTTGNEGSGQSIIEETPQTTMH